MSEDILERKLPDTGQRIAYGPEPRQFGDLRMPAGEGPHPVVIGIHGGYWRVRYDLNHFGHACSALTAAGFATWNIEYRRTGEPGGGWPGTFQDVAAAADFLRVLAPQYNLSLDHALSLGHSAGGHLAFWLAGRHTIASDSPIFTPNPLPLSGAVALAGAVDLRRRVGGPIRLARAIRQIDLPQAHPTICYPWASGSSCCTARTIPTCRSK